MMKTNEWTYNDNLFTAEQTEGFYGFVYLITNIDNNRKYIGRKYFTKAKTTQLKGKKKRSRVGSGWEDYWGSNKVLVEEIAAQGKEKYGHTLDRQDLSVLDWIEHAQQELQDGILYLEKLKQTLKGK